jgi:protease-4
LQHVADGRKMTVEEADKIARGRVWTGQDALQLGLVDTLGSLENAIAIAKKLAQIENYKIENFPASKSTMDIIMESIMGKDEDAVDKVLSKAFGDEYFYLKQVSTLKGMTGIQMRIPYAIRIR